MSISPSASITNIKLTSNIRAGNETDNDTVLMLNITNDYNVTNNNTKNNNDDNTYNTQNNNTYSNTNNNTFIINSNRTYDIDFISKMKSNDDGNIIQCDPNNFKYIGLLMQQLSHFNKTKRNSGDMMHAKYPTDRKRFIRLKHKNGTLYWPNTRQYVYHYRNWFIIYFHHLITKYSQYINDFDIIIFISDGRNHAFNYRQFPFFVSEGRQNPNGPLLLHSISRSLVRQFALEKEYQSYSNNKGNDTWNNKINAAVFRGSPTNPARDTVAYNINKNNNINNGSFYFNVKILKKGNKMIRGGKCSSLKNKCYTTDRMSVEEEMKYKYQIIIDGLGVRDAFSRQIRYQSVMLKQRSLLKEFWYHDLINNHNLIFWNDVHQLIHTMDDIQNKQKMLYQIALNGEKFAKTHLNIDSIDCFMVHILQIYNKYFFDEKSVEINDNDKRISMDTIYGNLIDCSKYHEMENDKIDTADQLCLFLNNRTNITALHKMQQLK